MKRTPDFWSNRKHQLLQQLSRTAKNGPMWTILNANQVQVPSVVNKIQDCEVGKRPGCFV